MDADQYGFQLGQAISSNFLMGLRENRAQQEQSLRERAFGLEHKASLIEYDKISQEQSMQNIMLDNQSDIYTQYQTLNDAALSGDFAKLQKLRWQEINPPGADPRSLNALNLNHKAKFDERRVQLLSNSAYYKNRMNDIEGLANYGNSPSVPPAERMITDGLRAKLIAGAGYEDLNENERVALGKSFEFQNQQALRQNPTYQAALINANSTLGKMQAERLKDQVGQTQTILNAAQKDIESARARFQEPTREQQKTYDNALAAYQTASTIYGNYVSGNASFQDAAKGLTQSKSDQRYKIKVRLPNGDYRSVPADNTQLFEALEGAGNPANPYEIISITPIER